jgi:glycerophosphoryl diester phosphodiesterase
LTGPPTSPLVIGHRGASAIESENSAAAFARARADSADGVELDAMICGTGEVVVFHDDDLVRLGRRPERIADTSFAVLRAATLTSGATIPTLEEAFEACGPDLLVNVELKVPDRGPAALAPLVDGVAASVARAGAAARVLVSSFHPWAVRLWMRRMPSIPAGLPFALHPEVVLCTPERVRGWHRRGYMVNVWTVDDAAALAACRRMGVDAVITNDPARSRALLAG